MTKQRVLAAALALAVGGMAGLASSPVWASDHDDGETDLKSRALNLTDHYAFRSGNELSLIMYVNPRSLPGRQYHLSTNARYELHVSKVANRTAPPTGSDDYVFRFEAGAPDAAGVQAITLTVLQDGNVIGTHRGTSTSFAASQANAVVTNTGTVGALGVRYFVGMRADSFYFDVVRFFQVRAFLAARFFGGAGGNGDATAGLAPNCRGDALLALGAEADPDADVVNLWNPPSCAPDFTKNLNVTAIALNVPIAALGGGTVFDTWSTISIAE
jgi:hypothetical protein